MARRSKEPSCELNVVKRGGVSYVEYGGMRFVIVCPSRGRERMILDHPWLPFMNVVVHESEVEAYEAAAAREGLGHGSLHGHDVFYLPAIYNWCMDHLYDEDEAQWMFCTDDDIRGLLWRWTLKGRSFNPLIGTIKTGAERMVGVVCRTALAALDLGTGQFGYDMETRIMERNSFEPFALRTWVSESFCGIIGKKVRWDEQLRDHEDIDLSLQMLCEYRVILKDKRWAMVVDPSQAGRLASSKGGMAGIRGSDTREDSLARLVAKWGDEVVRVGGGISRGAGFNVRVMIPKRYKIPRRE